MDLSHSVVSSILTQTLPLPQEAALMYAHGRVRDAARALEAAIAAGGSHELDVQAWCMLFDLHRAEGQWREFELLVGRFEELFGRGAPPWSNQEETAHLPPEMQSGGRACFEMSGALDASCTALHERMRTRAASHGALRLDLSKVTDLNREGCARLSEALRAISVGDIGVVVTGTDRLIHLLYAAAHGNAEVRPYWSLLLDVYRLRNMQKDFERIALEYALTTGEQPPEWQPVLMPLVAPQVIEEKRDQPRYQNGPDVIYLSGVMAGSGDSQLSALDQFGRDREYVNVNLSRLVRADFGCATALTSRVNGLARVGKTVRLLRPNTLVGALLTSFHLAPGVTIVPAGG